MPIGPTVKPLDSVLKTPEAIKTAIKSLRDAIGRSYRLFHGMYL